MHPREVEDLAKIVISLIAFIFLLLIASGNIPLPKLGVKNVTTMDGEQVPLESLYDPESKLTIVIYVSRACDYCEAMIPMLNELDAYTDIQVLAVYPDKDGDAVAHHVSNYRITYETVYGRKSPGAYPYTVFMVQDFDGNWIEGYVKVGYWDMAWFQQLVSGGAE